MNVFRQRKCLLLSLLAGAGTLLLLNVGTSLKDDEVSVVSKNLVVTSTAEREQPSISTTLEQSTRSDIVKLRINAAASSNLTDCDMNTVLQSLGFKSPYQFVKKNNCTVRSSGPLQKTISDLVSERNLSLSKARTVLARFERHRQKSYLKILQKKGQMVPAPGGGSMLISTAKSLLKMPISLKRKSVSDWRDPERAWLNVTHFPWPDDFSCSNVSIRFAPANTFPVVGLASIPSSGNTWVRYLIEGCTGYYTGSMYNDFGITRKGMYGESVPVDSGMTVVQKSHGYTTEDGVFVKRPKQIQYNHMEELNHTAVLVIRNPFETIISHRHLDLGGHIGLAPVAEFVGEKWDKFVRVKSGLWHNFYTDWLEGSAPERLLVVFYEELKKDLPAQLERIVAFLGVPLEPRRMGCVLEHPNGSFKRNKKPDFQNHRFYSRDQKRRIYEFIACLNQTLTSHGQPELPVHSYEMLDYRKYRRVKCGK